MGGERQLSGSFDDGSGLINPAIGDGFFKCEVGRFHGSAVLRGMIRGSFQSVVIPQKCLSFASLRRGYARALSSPALLPSGEKGARCECGAMLWTSIALPDEGFGEESLDFGHSFLGGVGGEVDDSNCLVAEEAAERVDADGGEPVAVELGVDHVVVDLVEGVLASLDDRPLAEQQGRGGEADEGEAEVESRDSHSDGAWGERESRRGEEGSTRKLPDYEGFARFANFLIAPLREAMIF